MPTFAARRLLRAAAWLIPLGVLANVGVALLTTDFHTFRELPRVTAQGVLAACALALLPWVTQSLRIGIWTRFVGHPVGFWSGLRVAAGGVLGSAVTPTAVGGGTIRWALTTRRGVPPGKAASLLAVEAVEDVVFFGLALPAAALFTAASELRAVRRAAGSPAMRLDDPVFAALAAGAVVLAGSAAGWRLALGGRLGERARGRALRLAAGVRRPLAATLRDARSVLGDVARRGKRWFALSLALTAVQWAARYSMATVVVVLLGGPLRPVLFWVLSWLTYAVSSGVPTPGAAGAAEATFFVLHAPVVAPERIVAVTAAWRLLMFYLPALAAVVAYPLLGRFEPAAGADAEARPQESPGTPSGAGTFPSPLP